MLIAHQKKQENISEYLLYMWQIEDIIRAYRLDLDEIDRHIISQFVQPETTKAQIREWYKQLIQAMKQEGIQQKGHLQSLQSIVDRLNRLHKQMLSPSSPNEEYSQIYHKTLPLIVELRAKNENKEISEVETCLSALYGYLLLRLQNKEISVQTTEGIGQISALMSKLSLAYKQLQQIT